MTEQLSPEKWLELSERWVARELERAKRVHGAAWPQVAEWVEAYVREEARQKLEARGVPA